MSSHSFKLHKNAIVTYVLLVILFLSSCNREDKEFFDSDDIPLSIRLQVLIDSRSLTRDEREGSELESYINLEEEDFRIIIYDKKGNKLEEYENSEVTFENNTLYFPLTLKTPIETDGIQLILVANWKNFVDYTSISFPDEIGDLWEGIYEFTLAQEETPWVPSISEKQLIPMIGISQGNLSDAKKENGRNLLNMEVNMLRSLAKISFQVNDELFSKGFDMNECQIRNYNENGILIPVLNTANGNSVNNDGVFSIKNASCPRTPSIKNSALKFSNEGTTNGKKILVAYLPEMDNDAMTIESNNRPYITASISFDGNKYGEDKTIEFVIEDKMDGKNLFDILRNNYYEYTIVNISDTEDFTFKYTVCPWREKETEIEFN